MDLGSQIGVKGLAVAKRMCKFVMGVWSYRCLQHAGRDEAAASQVSRGSALRWLLSDWPLARLTLDPAVPAPHVVSLPSVPKHVTAQPLVYIFFSRIAALSCDMA